MGGTTSDKYRNSSSNARGDVSHSHAAIPTSSTNGNSPSVVSIPSGAANATATMSALPNTHRLADEFPGDDGTVEETYLPGKSFQPPSTTGTSVKAANHGEHTRKDAPRVNQQSHGAGLNISTAAVNSTSEAEDELRKAVKPVTNQQLNESLSLLKYDIHREVQGILKEQVRQFAIARVSEFASLFRILYMYTIYRIIIVHFMLCDCVYV